MKIEYQPYPSKRILDRVKKTSSYQCSYVISPYIGCEYGCAYCHTYLDKEASSHPSKVIKVKEDAVLGLKKELKHAKKGMVCIIGYQPAERAHRIIRKVLHVLATRSFPLHIITRSDIVLDDVEAISQIAENKWCAVTFSINTLDENTATIFEPKAPSPKTRMEALGKVAKAGIRTGVALSPIIPYITDSDEQLEEIISSAKALNAQYVLSYPLKLEDDCKVRVIAVLKRHYPELLLKYKNLYEFGAAPDIRYSKKIRNKIHSLARQYEIAHVIAYPQKEQGKKQASMEDFAPKTKE